MAEHALLSSGGNGWRSLACAKSELRLDLTLACGQSFRWRETAAGHWTGVMGGRVWTLTQTDEALWYHVYRSSGGGAGQVRCRKRSEGVPLHTGGLSGKGFAGAVKKEEEEPVAVTEGDTDEEGQMLRDYFQLSVSLGDLYQQWAAADPHFEHIAGFFPGVRMLRQDPTECLFSLICTTNNNIPRIHNMVDSLCQALGAPLVQLDGTSYHDFPSLSELADGGVEARLRDLRFGYRARFLQQSAQILAKKEPRWLEGLRTTAYPLAHDALRELPGVGPKVANCVCLMSLDKAEAVPVDTHVRQIAERDYGYAAGKARKTITDRQQWELGDFFRKLWGPRAGWAQSVLFCADLKRFQALKEADLKRPKKEEDDEMEVSVAHEGTKTEEEGSGNAKKGKTSV
ncbi:N-glycosylase/DNA lyase [Pungitius pungitius]|uniref:N-glycosylase/DNA lyase n=1 Tax=Pungitius pungitius TaxID=134920 RepID=UPI002E164AE2